MNTNLMPAGVALAGGPVPSPAHPHALPLPKDSKSLFQRASPLVNASNAHALDLGEGDAGDCVTLAGQGLTYWNPGVTKAPLGLEASMTGCAPVSELALEGRNHTGLRAACYKLAATGQWTGMKPAEAAVSMGTSALSGPCCVTHPACLGHPQGLHCAAERVFFLGGGLAARPGPLRCSRAGQTPAPRLLSQAHVSPQPGFATVTRRTEDPRHPIGRFCPFREGRNPALGSCAVWGRRAGVGGEPPQETRTAFLSFQQKEQHQKRMGGWDIGNG